LHRKAKGAAAPRNGKANDKENIRLKYLIQQLDRTSIENIAKLMKDFVLSIGFVCFICLFDSSVWFACL